LPALMSLRELATIVYRISLNAAYKRERAGEFEKFEVKPAFGPQKYSGDRVRRWLQGEDLRPASRLKRSGNW